MTKVEFLFSVPKIINHKTWGYAELEVVAGTKDIKGVCYRHKDNTASYGYYALNWDELYFRFSKYLKEEGHMVKD
ncbi:MAG: hypothetical protein ABIN24_12960 [Dyadobacter sp.]